MTMDLELSAYLAQLSNQRALVTVDAALLLVVGGGGYIIWRWLHYIVPFVTILICSVFAAFRFDEIEMELPYLVVASIGAGIIIGGFVILIGGNIIVLINRTFHGRRVSAYHRTLNHFIEAVVVISPLSVIFFMLFQKLYLQILHRPPHIWVCTGLAFCVSFLIYDHYRRFVKNGGSPHDAPGRRR